MSTRKKRPSRGQKGENRPVVIWHPAPGKTSAPAGAPGVIPFPGERQEATVTEWVIPARSGQAPVKITVISSGFGIPTGKPPQSRLMAA